MELIIRLHLPVEGYGDFAVIDYITGERVICSHLCDNCKLRFRCITAEAINIIECTALVVGVTSKGSSVGDYTQEELDEIAEVHISFSNWKDAWEYVYEQINR